MIHMSWFGGFPSQKKYVLSEASSRGQSEFLVRPHWTQFHTHTILSSFFLSSAGISQGVWQPHAAFLLSVVLPTLVLSYLLSVYESVVCLGIETRAAPLGEANKPLCEGVFIETLRLHCGQSSFRSSDILQISLQIHIWTVLFKQVILSS